MIDDDKVQELTEKINTLVFEYGPFDVGAAGLSSAVSAFFMGMVGLGVEPETIKEGLRAFVADIVTNINRKLEAVEATRHDRQ